MLNYIVISNKRLQKSWWIDKKIIDGEYMSKALIANFDLIVVVNEDMGTFETIKDRDSLVREQPLHKLGNWLHNKFTAYRDGEALKAAVDAED